MGTLQSEIDKAAEEIKKDIKPLGDVKKEEPEVEDKEETSEDSAEGDSTDEQESEPETQDLSDKELIESKNLYKLLKDPNTANAVIAALAQQAGLLNPTESKQQAKVEDKAAKREVKSILADALGKEYSFLADRLGPAIETVLQQERENQDTRFNQIQQSQVERDVVTAYEKLARETKGESKQFENRMAQLSEEIPIGNMNVETYMKRLYVLASNEKRTSPQKIADRIRRNASDAPSRLQPTGRSGGVEIPQKKMSLDESIRWAQDQLKRK